MAHRELILCGGACVKNGMNRIRHNEANAYEFHISLFLNMWALWALCGRAQELIMLVPHSPKPQARLACILDFSRAHTGIPFPHPDRLPETAKPSAKPLLTPEPPKDYPNQSLYCKVTLTPSPAPLPPLNTTLGTQPPPLDLRYKLIICGKGMPGPVRSFYSDAW